MAHSQQSKVVTVEDFISKLRDKPKDQRVGQYFCNCYMVTDNELFYEKDIEKIWDKINYWLMLGLSY